MPGIPRFTPEQIEAVKQAAPGAAAGGIPRFSKEQIAAVMGDDSPAASPVTAATTGLMSGATGGFADEIGAAGKTAMDTIVGNVGPLAGGSMGDIANSYRRNRGEIRKDFQTAAQANPGVSLTANLAGAVVSPLSKLRAPQGMGPLTKLGTLGQEMKTAALQGGVYGAGNSDADLTEPGHMGEFARDTLIGAGTGAAVPPALAGATVAVKAGAKAAGVTGKKLFSSLFGVTEGNAAKYLENRQRINAAPELADIKAGVDADVARLAADVDSGKLSVEQAQEALRDLKTQVRNNLTDAKMDARDAVRRTEGLFKEAAAKAIQPIKDQRAPTALANEVVNAVEDLKRGVSEKSGAAWDTLEKSTQTMPKSALQGELDKAIGSLQVGGKGPVGQSAESAVASLQKLKGQLDALPDKLTMSQVKQIVQGLDRDINYRGAAGEFMDAASREKLGVRRAADTYLKGSVPEYAEAMGPVAEDSALLGEASQAFGDERRAIGRLGQVAGPKGALDRETLAKLEQSTGRPGEFTGAVDQYTRAQAILKDPAKLEEMRRALPEYQAYRQAMAKLAKMNPQWSRDQLESALSKSKEARALSFAEDALSKAQGRLDPVSSLGPASTEAKLKSFTKPAGAPIETERALRELEGLTGKQYIQPLKDRAVLDAFSKPYANGARNTVLWSMLGLAFGGLPGASGGAVWGQAIDRYGPKVGKAILDGIGKVRESPSVQTIRALNVPANVKTELEREFKIYMILKSAGERPQSGAMVAGNDGATDRKPAISGEDKWASDGIRNIQQHKQMGGPEMNQLLSTPAGKRLLVQASDLKPGSPAMERVYQQIQKELKGNRK